jgi:hypothetical protein
VALHDDLLDQAEHLASREPKRPRQASLRRAVSAAYYALFHLLAAEAARRFAPAQPHLLRSQVRRALGHDTMCEVCRGFAQRNPSKAVGKLLLGQMETELATVAATFVALHGARQEADYDLTATLNRVDVLEKIQRTRAAFNHWQSVKSKPNATVFLAALLLQRQWRSLP